MGVLKKKMKNVSNEKFVQNEGCLIAFGSLLDGPEQYLLASIDLVFEFLNLAIASLIVLVEELDLLLHLSQLLLLRRARFSRCLVILDSKDRLVVRRGFHVFRLLGTTTSFSRFGHGVQCMIGDGDGNIGVVDVEDRLIVINNG